MVDPASSRVNDSGSSGFADEDLLDGALAALGYRAEGFRLRRARPRAGLLARARDLGLHDADYLTLLRASAAERAVARRLVARVDGRLWRDPELWARLSGSILPSLGAARPEARIWVAEAGAGEEAFTLAMLWGEDPRLRSRPVRILATDHRPEQLERARAGRFGRQAARGLPPELRDRWLQESGAELEVAPEARARVAVAAHDLARDPWPFEVDLLLLRNSVFTLWGRALCQEAIARAAESLVSHGWLAIGRRERLDEPAAEPTRFVQSDPGLPLHRKRH